MGNACEAGRDDNIRAIVVIPLHLAAAIPIALAFFLANTGAAVAAPAKPAQAASARESSYGQRADVRAFAAEVATDSGLDRREVERWLGAARYQPKIVAAMDRPLLEPPKWFAYAPPFLTSERVDGGLRFWRENAAALERARVQYGVPPEMVVAIIGVETFYGRVTGNYRVLDALATLAFDYPRRAAFFRGELKEFLVLAHDQGFSPLTAKGSFAGAMGTPQFMPGSYRKFAVDFDADGHVDLWRSNADVIGSIANYFARHDWQPGQPVLLPAVVAGESRELALRRLDGGISERRPLAAWKADGVTPANAPADLAEQPVGLLLLEENADGAGGGEGASLWIACPNFYVITRYNKSRLYAAAVWSLAERLRAGR